MPPAAPPTAAARFWDRVADRYARMPVRDEAAWREKLAIIRGLMGPEAEVLELGCGTGSTALELAPHARRILAVDVSGRMLEIAREKAAAAGAEKVEFRRAGVEDLEATEGGFDMVLAMNLLHLLEDREGAMARVFRWLRPGGTFVSGTMCFSDGLGWVRWVAPVARRAGLFPALWTFSEARLTEELGRAGFAIERRWKPGPGKAVFLVARRPA
jgi:ubiquinone/menaquinone biosynthesis C-methylase UbiE